MASFASASLGSMGGSTNSNSKLATITSLSSMECSTSVVSASSQSQEFSLPSSFGGGSKANDDQAIETYSQGNETSSQTDDNSETQLALQVAKEVKPMLHLLKLLKEMDPDGEGGDAVNSLINEFEEEVVQIEHRIQNKNLICDGSDNGDDGSSSQLQDLPPDWIALEDPDSGDVYYANEVTGETTWDRPKVPKQLNQQQQTQDGNSQVSDNNNSSSNFSQYSETENNEEELPPGWVALEDEGDIYYANEVTGETTWDRPIMPKRQEQPQQTQRRNAQNSNDSSSNFSNDYTDDGDEGTDEEGEESDDEEVSIDESLPNDWIALVDQDSGETYYSNEVTGETTWDKPEIFNKQNTSYNDADQSNTSNDYSQEEEESEGELSEVLEGALPEGWISILDPDSGEYYYSNEQTGEVTWDRPAAELEKEEEIHDKTASQSQFDDENSTSENGSFDQGSEDQESDAQESSAQEEEEEGDLPEGWISLVDEDSGDVYYFNEVTGVTTWDRPIEDEEETSDSKMSSQDQPEFQNEQQDNNADEDLPPGWMSIVDPASGDVYYSNEFGETTWDKPEMPQNNLQIENEPSVSSNDDNGLPPGWYSVLDPASGDEYYVNDSGETTWDKPRALLQIEDTQSQQQVANNVGDDDDDLQDDYFAVVDPSSGDTYYVHEVTGETTWDKPIRQMMLANSAASDGEKQLAEGWFPVIDEASGDTYYANEHTGETSWDKPVGAPSVHDNINGMSRLSLSNYDNTVYEEDSVTSSQY